MAKILVPLDGSPTAEEALRLPCRQPGDELLLVRVLDPLTYLTGRPSAPTGLLEALSDEALAYLDRLRQELPGPSRTFLRLGNPVEEIVELAREEAVDWLELTSHGRSGVGRWIIGSVAENICRRVPCPAWLLPAGAAPRSQTALLVAVDASETSRRAIEVAARLQPRPARVVLMRATDIMPGFPNMDLAGARHTLQETLLEDLEKAAEPLRQAGIATTCQVEDGYAAASILDAAERENVDALVLGTHGRTGWKRFLMGSVAEMVARHGKLPVLLVNSKIPEAPRRA